MSKKAKDKDSILKTEDKFALDLDSVRLGLENSEDILEFYSDTNVAATLDSLAHALLKKFLPHVSTKLNAGTPGSELIYLHTVNKYMGTDEDGTRFDYVRLTKEECSKVFQYVFSDLSCLVDSPNLKVLVQALQEAGELIDTLKTEVTTLKEQLAEKEKSNESASATTAMCALADQIGVPVWAGTENVCTKASERLQTLTERETEHAQELVAMLDKMDDILIGICGDTSVRTDSALQLDAIMTRFDRIAHHCRTWKKNATNASEAAKAKAAQLADISRTSILLEDEVLGNRLAFGSTALERLERVYKHFSEKSKEAKEVIPQQPNMLQTLLMMQLFFGKSKKRKEE